MENVGQKLSRSRNIFSETRVTTLENNRIVQPEGKQLLKENVEDPCSEVNARSKLAFKISRFIILFPQSQIKSHLSLFRMSQIKSPTSKTNASNLMIVKEVLATNCIEVIFL